MNIHMNELHLSCENDVCDIISLHNNVFHMEGWPWACLDVVDDFFSFSPWHLIGV